MTITIHVTCPVCQGPDLEVRATIVADSQGEPPYTIQFDSLDDYTIDWNDPAHVRCGLIFGCLRTMTDIHPSFHTRAKVALYDLQAQHAQDIIDAFEQTIYARALEAAQSEPEPLMSWEE